MGIRNEIKKIHWPKKKDALKTIAIVGAVTLLLAGLCYLSDTATLWLLKILIG